MCRAVTSNPATYIASQGTLTVDLASNAISEHDGVTPGGIGVLAVFSNVGDGVTRLVGANGLVQLAFGPGPAPSDLPEGAIFIQTT